MSYIPDHIRLAVNPDVLRNGAERINDNLDAIATHIELAIEGRAYQNPVLAITNTSPTTGITVGSRYIVDFGVLEADPWYGHVDEIAELIDDSPYTWDFFEPSTGWTVTVIDEITEYIYNDEQWSPRGALVSHNSLAGIDGGGEGATYHITEAISDALMEAESPGVENPFITNDILINSWRTTHTHDGGDTPKIDYANLKNVPDLEEHTHTVDEITDFAHAHAKADITDFDHAADHINDEGDEIDGDKLDIDFNPSYYTPAVVTETDDEDDLSSHLHGVDVAIRDILTDINEIEAGTIESIDLTEIDCGSVTEAPAGIWVRYDVIDGGSFSV